jgi:hypothetical protein
MVAYYPHNVAVINSDSVLIFIHRPERKRAVLAAINLTL